MERSSSPCQEPGENSKAIKNQRTLGEGYGMMVIEVGKGIERRRVRAKDGGERRRKGRGWEACRHEVERASERERSVRD